MANILKKLFGTKADRDLKEINPNLPAYSQLSSIKVMENEFEKTPKKSIKRFLYQNIDL